MSELREAIQKNTVMCKTIPVEQSCSLWQFATPSDYRTIGHLIGISKAAVCVIVKDVCSAIVQVLLPRYTKIPTGTPLKEVVHGFEHKWGFSQCTVAVDGTHIPIMFAPNFSTDYFNSKGWHPNLEQGMVDHH